MKTREELDAEWAEIDYSVTETDMSEVERIAHGNFRAWLDKLIAAERAFVDREVAAKAIRWAAIKLDEAEGWSPAGECIGELADQIESGAIDIAEVLK